MKCPRCQFENRGESKFCLECGLSLELECTNCGNRLPLTAKYCDACGTESNSDGYVKKAAQGTESERKYVTVLFSDLSDFTSITEKLDPEEVKAIMIRIFGGIARVVVKYEGFIERFIGDAVMALFGVPKAHEDDPVRAIKAAMEIHNLVEAMSSKFEDRVGQKLRMHSGINTGLVVTGEVDLERGTHGITGGTINLASRIEGIAKAGEILIGPDTYRQVEGYFRCQRLEPVKVKGKSDPVEIFRVVSARERPVKMHRLNGRKADLIGRKAELNLLTAKFQRLREGSGSIISISGAAGTGKSRLVEEFRLAVDTDKIQWLSGQAFPYSKNIPYFPFIDLLNRMWHIDEGDPPEIVREKIETNIRALLGENEEAAPYIGRFYALSYPGIEGMSPELWRKRLKEAVHAIFSQLAQKAPIIICWEDIQWADPSSIELLRLILPEFTGAALFICVYRPPFCLFDSHQLESLEERHLAIQLRDLSSSEAQDMIESLLKSKNLPQKLLQYNRDRVGGNPFYLEEVVNSLIESETITPEKGAWRLNRHITEAVIPSTIHGVISARLDRLEKEMKRILQEASVIGRSFLYEILKRVTDLTDHIDQNLRGLERTDFIRKRSIEPELEYIFKHALTQEVVYNGLLRSERQKIHERVAAVYEDLFEERLPEFYETIAFHYKQGYSLHKAVNYLMKSGEKSLSKYAVEESHQYFNEAYELLNNKRDRTKEEDTLLIDLLNKWAFVFYYRGDYKGLPDLLVDYKDLAESLDDKARLSMFYSWLGVAVFHRERFQEAYQYLKQALLIGEEMQDSRLIGYACNWLIWTCAELGLLDEAVDYGDRCQEVCRLLKSEEFLYWISLAGIGQVCWYRGETKKTYETGKKLLEYSLSRSNIRGVVLGHYLIGCSHFMVGDFASAVQCYKESIELSVDPYYSHWSRMLLCLSYVSNNQFREAEEALEELLGYTRTFWAEVLGTPAEYIRGIVLVGKGQLAQGIKILEDIQRSYQQNARRWCYALSEHILGTIYSQIAEGAGPKDISTIVKNINFLIRNKPFAWKKAEGHYKRAINAAQKIGADITLGMSFFNLGLLHRGKGNADNARQYLAKAVRIFEKCEAEIYLGKAKNALLSLE